MKKHSFRTRLLTAAMAVAMLFTMVFLTGCEGEAVDDPNAGLYVAETADMKGLSLSISEVYPDGFTIELKGSGKCVLKIGEKSANGSWTLDGSHVNVKGGGIELSGTLDGDSIVFKNVDNSGINLTFWKEGTYDPSKSSGTDILGVLNALAGEENSGLAPETMEWWDGDWYGWWAVCSDSGTGAYESWSEKWWDTMARITVNADGSAYFLIWDQDFTPDDALCEIDATIVADPDSGVSGYAVSKGGYFLDMKYTDDLRIDPSYYGIENMIVIEGTYTDDAGTFDYNMYLRPWGQDWSDLDEDDADAVGYKLEDMYPYYYEDWYLPAIANGETMPNVIGPED